MGAELLLAGEEISYMSVIIPTLRKSWITYRLNVRFPTRQLNSKKRVWTYALTTLLAGTFGLNFIRGMICGVSP
jgi:hypothetical protein